MNKDVRNVIYRSAVFSQKTVSATRLNSTHIAFGLKRAVFGSINLPLNWSVSNALTIGRVA